MKKLLTLVMALFFVTATSGLVLAQDTTAPAPVQKVHKVRKSVKGHKKHHSKKKKVSKMEAPAAQ